LTPTEAFMVTIRTPFLYYLSVEVAGEDSLKKTLLLLSEFK
jgi:hypothetical protein